MIPCNILWPILYNFCPIWLFGFEVTGLVYLSLSSFLLVRVIVCNSWL